MNGAPMSGSYTDRHESESSELQHNIENDVPPVILLSDDDSIMLELMSLVLHNAPQISCISLGTCHGTTTWMLTKRLRPNLIITDISKVDMSGLELIARIKSNSELRNIPVLVASASTAILKQSGLRYTPEAVMSKSFSPAELLDNVSALLSEHKLPPISFRDLVIRKTDTLEAYDLRDPLVLVAGGGLNLDLPNNWVVCRKHTETTVMQAAVRLLPDVIILNPPMTDITDRDLLSMFKAHAYLLDIPVIVISDNASIMRNEAISSGADGVYTATEFNLNPESIIRSVLR